MSHKRLYLGVTEIPKYSILASLEHKNFTFFVPHEKQLVVNRPGNS